VRRRARIIISFNGRFLGHNPSDPLKPQQVRMHLRIEANTSPMRMRARSHAPQGEEKKCKYCATVYMVNRDGGVVPALTAFAPQSLV
jgi:hypothetical protein